MPRRNRPLPIVFALLLPFLFQPAPAGAIAGDTDGPIGLDGSFRTVPVFLDNGAIPRYFAPEESERRVQNALRLVAAGRLPGSVAWEIHGVQTADYSESGGSLPGGGGDPFLTGGGGRLHYRAADLTSEWIDEERWSGSFSIDRLLLKGAFSRLDLAVGRQAIGFGKAYFWNPLDLFAPFDPRRFDRDYKSGVDAVRVDLALGGFSGLNLIAAAGDRLDAKADGFWSASWYGSAAVARWFTTLSRFDIALQGGKVFGGALAGGALAGEAGPLEVRFEGARFFAARSDPLPWPFEGEMLDDHWSAVIGVGRTFENSFTLQTEFLYNGLGDPDDLNASFARLAGGHTFHAGRRIAGFLTAYDLLPILRGSLAALVSIDDRSFQVQPGLTWSAGDNTELLVGGIWNVGEEMNDIDDKEPGAQSEFGSYPQILYMEYKRYF